MNFRTFSFLKITRQIVLENSKSSNPVENITIIYIFCTLMTKVRSN